jgi:hypothetical protein
MVNRPLPDRVNEAGKNDRQKCAAPGKALPESCQIQENQGVITPLTTFGTAVAWEVSKTAVGPVRT